MTQADTIQFDFAAVAEDLGMKDEKSVRARWNTIKRTKLNADAAPAGGVDKTSATKKKVTPKKTLAEKPSEYCIAWKAARPLANEFLAETEAKVTPTKKRGRKSNVEKALELVAAANAEEAETKEAEQEEVAEKVDEKMDTAIKAETEDDAAEKEDSMTD